MQVQKMYEAFKMGDIPTVLSGLSRDVIWEVMGQPDVPFAGIYHGPDCFDTLAFAKGLSR